MNRSPWLWARGCRARPLIERELTYIEDLRSTSIDIKRGYLLTDEKFISYYGVPLVAKGKIKGVLEIFHRSPLAHDAEWLQFLEALAGQTAIAIDSSSTFQDLQRSNMDLALAYDATIEGWSHALDLSDKETEGHTLRVTEAALTLAQALGIAGRGADPRTARRAAARYRQDGRARQRAAQAGHADRRRMGD